MSLARLPRIALCAALLCAVVPSARALQLGETRQQLIARHGNPGAEDHARNLAMYFWEGWSAQVEFQGDSVSRLTYRRNYYLQDAEINALLQSNGGTARWREVSVTNAQMRQWARDDGAIASCARNRPVSIVFQNAAAVAQQSPQVVVPVTPFPSTKAPNFPKMLDTVPEPELPVADSPPPLPKLPAAEIVPENQPSTAPAPAAAAAEAAIQPPAAPAPAEPLSAPAASSSHALAYTLGFLAILALLAAGGWFYLQRRPRSGGRTRSVRADISPSSLSVVPGLGTMRFDQFELLIAELYRREGYTVELSGALSSEDTIDLTLRRDSETFLVQCKHWRAPQVTESETRDLAASMATCGAPRGILVTTGGTSAGAKEFAATNGIEILDGIALTERMTAVANPGENLSHVSEWIGDFVAHARVFDPECPVCQGTMVIHHNRANGTPTWNCRGYPRCPGRREPRLDLLPATSTR